MTTSSGSRQHVWQRTLTRRRVLKGMALSGAGLVVAGMLGCGREERPTTTPVAKTPKPGGIINVGLNNGQTRGRTLDPHTSTQTFAATYRLFYQGLLGFNAQTNEVEPELARGWEQPSQTEYIFSLQPGVKWHNKPPANGRPLTADDIVFSLNRAQSPDPRFQHRAIFTTVDRIEAPTPTTIKVTTKGPDAALMSKLSADGPLILAPEVAERAGRFVTADAVVGTGPFIMKSMEDNVGAEYVRNPDYWKPGRPYLDGLRTQHLTDEQAGYAALLAGQVHITRLPGNEVKNYIARRGPNYSPDWFKDNTSIQAVPNTAVKPLDDPRVARALRLLMDHDEFKTTWAETWFGRGRHGSVLPTGLDAWDLSEEEYSQQIFWRRPKDEAAREAVALLRAAGFTPESPLRFELASQGQTTQFFVVATELLQAQWKRLTQGAVDVQIRQYDLAQALQVQAQGSFAYAIWGLAGATTEPDAWLSMLYHSEGSRNRMRLKDATLDSMIDRQRTLFDLQQRRVAVREIVAYMMERSPGVIISNRYFLNGLSPRVRDYAPEFFINGRQYEWVWLDT